MNILLTGTTGFIGQRIVKRLSSEGHKIYLLVRPASLEKAQSLFRSLKAITLIEGDIEETDVVKNLSTVSQHLDDIDTVVHLAAFYDLKATLSQAYLKNVVGTQNVLDLLGKMSGLKSFHYFSTYAVNPVPEGTVSEDFLLSDDLTFYDHYSKTKNHAEHLVRKFERSGVNVIIHRPGVIIGDSQSGAFDKTDGPYYFFDFIQKLKKFSIVKARLPFIPLPLKENSFLPIVPVDVLADWCVTIINHPPVRPLSCYHLVPSPLVETKDFLEMSLDSLGLPLKIYPLKHHRLLAPLLPLMNVPAEASFYLNQQTVFDRSHLDQDYPQLKSPPYQSYLPSIIRGYLKGKK